MVYVIELLEKGVWVHYRGAQGVVMFSRKRDAEAYVRRLEQINRGPEAVEGYRYRKVVD